MTLPVITYCSEFKPDIILLYDTVSLLQNYRKRKIFSLFNSSSPEMEGKCEQDFDERKGI